MKRTEDFIKEMESSNILMSRKYTFTEYVSEIKKFEEMVCKMIAGNEYHEGMHFDEARFLMESTARKKDLRNHPAVTASVLTMKKLEKEMAIMMSGAKGEKLISKTLEYLNRPNTQVFRNVYVTDGIDETELDGVVLTNESIIILEVKNVKSDLTLTRDGRMVFADDASYDKVPLGQKMQRKRRLLKKCLEKAVAEKGLNIPVHVDSFIVFSAPKDLHIKIDDQYRREKYCFRSTINKKIENYFGCAYYKADHLAQLGGLLSEMEANVKRFETELNYDEVRRNIADAMVVLQDVSIKDRIAKIFNLDVKQREEARQQVGCKATSFGYAVASAFAGLFIYGAVAMLGVRHS